MVVSCLLLVVGCLENRLMGLGFMVWGFALTANADKLEKVLRGIEPLWIETLAMILEKNKVHWF